MTRSLTILGERDERLLDELPIAGGDIAEETNRASRGAAHEIEKFERVGNEIVRRSCFSLMTHKGLQRGVERG